MTSIFALSKDQSYASYSTFYNNGFPVMFSTKNNHIYFSDCNTPYSIYDFSCDKLSLNPASQNINKGNLMFGNQTNMKQFVSEIYVNDHTITCTYNSIIMPIVKNGLKYVSSSNSIEHDSRFSSSQTLYTYKTTATPNYGYLVSETTFSAYNITYDTYGHVINTSFNKMIVPTSQIILSCNNSSNVPLISFEERINGSNVKTTSTIQFKGENNASVYKSGDDILSINVPKNITTISYYYESVLGETQKGFKIKSTHNTDDNNVYIITKTGGISSGVSGNSIGTNTTRSLSYNITYNNNTYYCYISSEHCTAEFKKSVNHAFNSNYIYPGSDFYSYKFNYDNFGHLIKYESVQRYVSTLDCQHGLTSYNTNGKTVIYHSYTNSSNPAHLQTIPTSIVVSSEGHVTSINGNRAGVTNIIKCNYDDYKDSSKYNKGAGSYASYLFLIT